MHRKFSIGDLVSPIGHKNTEVYEVLEYWPESDPVIQIVRIRNLYLNFQAMVNESDYELSSDLRAIVMHIKRQHDNGA